MKRKDFRLMLFAVTLAGFLGGVFSSFVAVETVSAQKKSAPYSDVVKAENFDLVDKQGRTRARLMMGKDDEPMLVVYDKNEKPTAVYGLNGEGPIQNLLDRFMRP